jgi:hypothetical protein
MNTNRTCIALAFDSAMFVQGRECIRTIQKHWVGNGEVCVLSVGLQPDEEAWLRQNGVRVQNSAPGVPVFAGAPRYALAQTCRPWLRELFPGFDLYLWMDADVRICSPDVFAFYLGNASRLSRGIVICQEVDPAYCFVSMPQISRNYHRMKFQRMQAAYGPQIAELVECFHCFNSGVFAMHRESEVWQHYQSNVQRAIQSGYDHMKEQDAMNIAILQSNMQVCVAPAFMNWLCSVSFPGFDAQSSRWVRPVWPHIPISVLHLTNSNTVLQGETRTY